MRSFCRYCRLLQTITYTTLLTHQANSQRALLWHFSYQQPLAHWNTATEYALPLGRDSLGFWFTYNALSERPYSTAFRNELQGGAQYMLNPSPRWALYGRLSGDVFQDLRQAASERVRARFLGGAIVRPLWGFIRGELGWEVLQQPPSLDRGWSGGIAAFWKPKSSLLSLDVSADGTLFQGWRRWHDLAARLVWEALSRDTLARVSYHRLMQDFPGIGAEFYRRRQQTLSGELRLSERFVSTLTGRIALSGMHTSIWQSRIRPSTDSLPLRSVRLGADLATGLLWVPRFGSFDIEFALRYAEETYRTEPPSGMVLPAELQQRRVQLALQEYSSLWSQLSAHLALALSGVDTVALSALLGILRYDTPSPQNTDDRDEQQSSVLLRYSRVWRSGIHLRGTLEFQRRHTVFLQAPRSAWNHQLFSLALRWEVRWQTTTISWHPQWEISANYTVRDYPYTNLLRDLALRQWGYRDSLLVGLAPGWKAEATLFGRYTTIGLLDWQRFAEQPQGSQQELTAALLLLRSRGDGSWGLGVRYAHLRYGYAGTALGEPFLQTSLGPQVRVNVVTAYGTLSISGWYELRRLGESSPWHAFPWISLRMQKP